MIYGLLGSAFVHSLLMNLARDRIIESGDRSPWKFYLHDLLDLIYQFLVVGCDKSVGFPIALGSSRASDPVNIGVCCGGHIKIDHMGNSVNIKPAGSDICSYHDLVSAISKTI